MNFDNAILKSEQNGLSIKNALFNPLFFFFYHFFFFHSSKHDNLVPESLYMKICL